MLVKTYGIYLLHSPTVDLKAEGLSRYLAEFLKAAQSRDDVEFVIACPSWIHGKLNRFFIDFGIHPDRFSIISPDRQPWLLRLYDLRNQPKKGPGRLQRLRSWFLKQIRTVKSRYTQFLLQGIAGSRTKREIPFFIFILMVCAIGSILVAPFLIISKFLKLLPFLLSKNHRRIFFAARRKLGQFTKIRKFFSKTIDALSYPIYQLMTDAEATLMLELINGRKDILAWYSPTAFWTQFNKISKPRLMCVPDVVPLDFPVGFSFIGNSRFVNNVRQLEKAIRGGEHFVTYSETVKWRTLVDRYNIVPDSISVIPHGANQVDHWIRVSGFDDNAAATDSVAKRFFRSALKRSVLQNPTLAASSTDFDFLFYASQFRPNKNVITLLKSYEYLLRKRHISQKLVLTGNPHSLSQVEDFIIQHQLQYDVVFLVGLSQQELASCYRLADLVVNPTFSEGGCPFTFTEALSVDTPVVMSRISVAEEVLVDADLQEMMLFDPYDWKDMANRIEWALNHRTELLSIQTTFYSQLSQRSWLEVVSEHLDLLDKISCLDHG